MLIPDAVIKYHKLVKFHIKMVYVLDKFHALKT